MTKLRMLIVAVLLVLMMPSVLAGRPIPSIYLKMEAPSIEFLNMSIRG